MSTPTPIPPELWRVVLGYLSGVERVRVGRVCRQWKGLAPVIAGPVEGHGDVGWDVPIFEVEITGHKFLRDGLRLVACLSWGVDGVWCVTEPPTARRRRVVMISCCVASSLDGVVYPVSVEVLSLCGAVRRFGAHLDEIDARVLDLTGMYPESNAGIPRMMRRGW